MGAESIKELALALTQLRRQERFQKIALVASQTLGDTKAFVVNVRAFLCKKDCPPFLIL